MRQKGPYSLTPERVPVHSLQIAVVAILATLPKPNHTIPEILMTFELGRLDSKFSLCYKCGSIKLMITKQRKGSRTRRLFLHTASLPVWH